jgi:hypothetical protein
LLQRIDAEGVGDRVVGKLAVGAVGAHHEPVVTLEEGRFDALVPEPDVGEIAENAVLRRLLHGQSVMRSCPGLVFGCMAGHADRAADVGGQLAGRRGGERVGWPGWAVRQGWLDHARQEIDARAADGNQQQDDGG